ncbi:hypothetical protein KSP40_PGU002278 [Platanthera guangdongensis]|uniref:Uncharacterized protein n=1 Tax=Platanthera guangdongensis TaxID=2320717 RepID=A0ABR2MYE7_9ASPA
MVLKKEGKGYIPKFLYVICHFDSSLLPIKLNLPMESIIMGINSESTFHVIRPERRISRRSG